MKIDFFRPLNFSLLLKALCALDLLTARKMLPSSFEWYLKSFKHILGTVSDEEFVRHIQQNPILWDTRCSDYKDCKEKALVWDSVGNACGITGEQARLKWYDINKIFYYILYPVITNLHKCVCLSFRVSLREKYRREKLYWENIEKNGNSSNAPLKEFWGLMKEMAFIDAVSTRRQ